MKAALLRELLPPARVAGDLTELAAAIKGLPLTLAAPRPIAEAISSAGGVRFEGSEGWVEVSRERLRAEPSALLTSRIGPNEIHLGPKGTGGTHMGIWLDCIRKRSPRGLNVTVEIGHRSATVCHLGNIAMELGRKLKWDAAKEQVVGDDEANRLLTCAMRPPWKL